MPAGVGFAPRPKLAGRIIARAIAASVPFKWGVGDTIYGVATSNSNDAGRTRLRTLPRKSPVTAASPLPRYGAIKQRARSRPCYYQLHHQMGHDPLLPRKTYRPTRDRAMITRANASPPTVLPTITHSHRQTRSPSGRLIDVNNGAGAPPQLRSGQQIVSQC